MKKPHSPRTPRNDGQDPRRHVITAYDVARLAGLSQSTVSRTFTQGASVSAATRQKVVAAAGQLGYRPNLIARSLITQRSNIVGVGIGYLENQFYPAVLEALSVALEELGYRVLLFTTKLGERADPIIEEILHYRVDALVLASINLSSHLGQECRKAGVPVVAINRRTDEEGVSSVTCDNYDGAQTVAAFLMAGGHQRYAFMAGVEDSSTSRDREAGFHDYLAGRGIALSHRAVGHYDFEAATLAARALFSADQPPDALFCANDHMALAALNVARTEFGREVGRDLSIIGFDDVAPAAWPLVDLTTYSQPVERMVDAVMAILGGQLAEAPGPALHEIIEGELVVRGSARLPPSGVAVRPTRRVWAPRKVR